MAKKSSKSIVQNEEEEATIEKQKMDVNMRKRRKSTLASKTLTLITCYLLLHLNVVHSKSISLNNQAATTTTTTSTLAAIGQQQRPLVKQPNYLHQNAGLNRQANFNQQQPTVIQPIQAAANFNSYRGVSRFPSGPAAMAAAQHQRQQHQAQIQHFQVPQVCQLPEELKAHTKCLGRQDRDLKLLAKSEFVTSLSETSNDVKVTLASYLNEFRSISLGLVLLAHNDTQTRLRHSSNLNGQQLADTQLITRRLFDSLFAYLSSSHSTVMSDLNQPQAQSQKQAHQSQLFHLDSLFQMPARVATHSSHLDVTLELNNYFRRLHLIQLKRSLEDWSSSSLDLECLDINLSDSNQMEALISELLQQTQSQQTSINDQLMAMKVEQARLVLSLKQSLEFTRTLLNSLALSQEMFANLTERADDWMPSSACHAALSRMTVCQECHVTSGVVVSHASTSQQQQQSGSISIESMVAPCENYCLNVARGCMNDLFELDRFWWDQVNSLARFKTNLIQTNNIENVMFNLDLKLVSFMEKLQQQYGTIIRASSSSSSSSNGGVSDTNVNNQQQRLELPISSELIKRCPITSPPASQQLATGSSFGLLRSAADWFQPQRTIIGRPASKMLPATQQRPALLQMSEAALRARQSAALSLFNRLDGLTHQLEDTRDFFVRWPQLVCQRIRSRPLEGGSSVRRANGTTSSAHECWNGRDFSGRYSKPLAPFGEPINAAHPEVAVAHTQPVSPMVLNLVARLKETSAQLLHKSLRSPYNPVDLIAGKLVVPVGSKRTKQFVASQPLAEAQVSRQQEQLLTAAALSLTASQGLAELDNDPAPSSSASSGSTRHDASDQQVSRSSSQTLNNNQPLAGEELDSGSELGTESSENSDTQDEDAVVASSETNDNDGDGEDEEDEDTDCKTPLCDDLLDGKPSATNLPAFTGDQTSATYQLNANNNNNNVQLQQQQNGAGFLSGLNNMEAELQFNANNNHIHQTAHDSTTQARYQPMFTPTDGGAEVNDPSIYATNNNFQQPYLTSQPQFDVVTTFSSNNNGNFYNNNLSSSTTSMQLSGLQIFLLSASLLLLLFLLAHTYRIVKLYRRSTVI